MSKYLLLIPILSILVLFTDCDTNTNNATTKKLSLDSLVVLYPDSIPLLVKLGNDQLKKYNFEKSFQTAARAFRLDSNNAEVRLLYANALNNKLNRLPNDLFKAQRHFNIVLKKQPKNTDALIGLAAAYSQLMDFENSFKYINKALRNNPKLRDAYTLKGSNYLKLYSGEADPKAKEKYMDLAKSSYETAVQQDPKFFEAYLWLGALYQSEGNKICIEYYTTASQLQPKNTEVLFSLAYAKQLFGEYKSATSIYRKMIQLDTSNAIPLNQIGVIKRYNENQLDSAIYYYNSAIMTDPSLVEAWQNLGLAYEAKKDIPNALKSYAKALKYNPNYTPARERANALK
jgi:tetratricopeptide (TPR) repeat protein